MTESQEPHSSTDLHLIGQITRLRVDAMLGKKKHFNAADRKAPRLTLTAWLPIVLSLLLASAFFFQVQQHFPVIATWMGTLLGILAAFLSWLDTAYGTLPYRHRVVGQRFIEVQNECDDLLAAYHDNVVDVGELRSTLTLLRARYNLCNSDAAHLQVSRRDFDRARRGIQDGEEHYRDDELAS